MSNNSPVGGSPGVISKLWQFVKDITTRDNTPATGHQKVEVVQGQSIIPRGPKQTAGTSLNDREVGLDLNSGFMVIKAHGSIQNAWSVNELETLWKDFQADSSLDNENRNLLRQAIENRRQVLSSQ